MSAFPLHIRLGIRNIFDNPQSSLNKTLTAFNSTTGFIFSLEIDWQHIWETVKDLYEDNSSNTAASSKTSNDNDKATLVPGICGYLEIFLREFERYLEKEDAEGGFQDRWIAKVEESGSVGNLKIFVELIEDLKRSKGKESPRGVQPRSYFNSRAQWRIDLPIRNERGYQELGNSVLDVIMGTLDDPNKAKLQQQIAAAANAGTSSKNVVPVDVPEWDVVDDIPDPTFTSSSSRVHAAPYTGPPPPPPLVHDFTYPTSTDSSNLPPIPLPNAASLPNPTTLFPSLSLQSPPILILTATSPAYIDIQCSHSATLELIHTYFTRHARRNYNLTNQPPFLKVALLSSMWGTGSASECIRIEREDSRILGHAGDTSWCRLDVAYIIAFIEGVCGYRLVSGCTGENGTWVFRRLRRFA